ncbi:unnamed protein product, partial [Adineta ricciae]
MFVNIIPLRCQLNPQWSLYRLIESVSSMMTNSLKHSYFPLQRILAQHPHIVKPEFLDVLLESFVDEITMEEEKAIIGDATLHGINSLLKVKEKEIIEKSDFAVYIAHDPVSNHLRCMISGSLDIFDIMTVNLIAQRFRHMLCECFEAVDDQFVKPIYEVQITLAHEKLLVQSMNNSNAAFPPITCIHHEFVSEAMKHPQKIAVELSDQFMTYAELLYYAQLISLHLVSTYHISPGEIVCQCIERSLFTVIGILAIEMAGAAYCPLSSQDPSHRLHVLIRRTNCQLVLVHWSTKNKFAEEILLFNVDSAIHEMNFISYETVRVLSKIMVSPESIGYIIFTSGSTGTPKAVQLRHCSFVTYMRALVIQSTDIGLHHTSVTFDAHLSESIGILMKGGQVVILKPFAQLDMESFIRTLCRYQVSYIGIVPSQLINLVAFLRSTDEYNTLETLRCVATGGESIFTSTIIDIQPYLNKQCQFYNYYGPTECSESSIEHVISDEDLAYGSIPLGRPMASVSVYLVDDYLIPVISDIHVGEIVIGGVGLFAGYRGQDELMKQVLCTINNQTYYKTGDMGRINSKSGVFEYVGRRDYQVKLRGQRIELSEIESVLMDVTTMSVVVKLTHDNNQYLVAYVETKRAEHDLRQHCLTRLPLHMVPSFFVRLHKLPLNQNGKINRKALPSVDFSALAITPIDEDQVVTAMEQQVFDIWRTIFPHLKSIPRTSTSFFSIGGHSLLIMQLFHRYRTLFNLEPNTLSIADLFQNPTISGHAQLIQQATNTTDTEIEHHWLPLHAVRGKNRQLPSNDSSVILAFLSVLGIASFAQQRIFLDEQIRLSSAASKNIYAIPHLYRLSAENSHISISRFHQALHAVIMKHSILRTALYLHTDGTIVQECLSGNMSPNEEQPVYGFTVMDLQKDGREINEITKEIQHRSDLFDLSQGRVLQCHIFKHSQVDGDVVTNKDFILLNIHHAAFDGMSTLTFLSDLSFAYKHSGSLHVDENTLQYIDYSIHEHVMDMSASRDFWHSHLQGYNLEYQIPLPMDKKRSSTDQRSGQASSTHITLAENVAEAFLNYASSHHLTLFQLGLATFYAFLFKLTHSQNDLCIASINANRYRSEISNMIGMFVSTLPHRIQLDSNWPFDQLVTHVRDEFLSILAHSHYPLQHIFVDFHLNQSNASFLETMFDFINLTGDAQGFSLNDVHLEQMPFADFHQMRKFDFALTFMLHSETHGGQLTFSLTCSQDQYESTTVSQLAQRFEYLVEQIFLTKNCNELTYGFSCPIEQLSLILPNEREEINNILFCRQSNQITEAPASYAQARIWLDERTRFDPDKPQLAIYNMPFLYRLATGSSLSVQQL